MLGERPQHLCVCSRALCLSAHSRGQHQGELASPLPAQLTPFLSLLSSSLSCSPPDVQEKSFPTVSFGWKVTVTFAFLERMCACEDW